MAVYVAGIGEQAFTEYWPGLLVSAWPLGVAALLFILLDIRLNLPESSKFDPYPETPAPRKAKPGERPAMTEPFSYFAYSLQAAPAQEPLTRTAQLSLQATKKMPMPPAAARPAEPARTEPQNRPAGSAKAADSQPAETLSFFKL